MEKKQEVDQMTPGKLWLSARCSRKLVAMTAPPALVLLLLGSAFTVTHGREVSPWDKIHGVAAVDATVSFGSSALAGESLINPTSLQFGPDSRLYVSQQDGRIFAYTVVRDGPNDYRITDTETIDLVQKIRNHNDDGSINSSVNTRQVTGLLVTGAASKPVLYVGSSDPRIEVNNTSPPSDSLDTNSSMLSRLTWTGSRWSKLDLVRGLPRSEENHSINGMVLNEPGNILYVMIGGNTNMGAPSNGFSGLPEYALTTALLAIDLNAIGNRTYDLPTLVDDDHVSGNLGNDPFGGNDGNNQAILAPGGPVSIHSTGWRNAYDVVRTTAGKLYTVDNGPNGGWGGTPINCSNQMHNGGGTFGDSLHYIASAGYYGGHPNPTRGDAGNTFNLANPQSAVAASNPVECEYRVPGKQNGALTVFDTSTNGLAEYTASNFDGAMKGNLLAASYSGDIWRLRLNKAGDGLAVPKESLLSNFGTIPLDVTVQSDGDVFPGTIWAATYGSNAIQVFEPADYDGSGAFVCTGRDLSRLDEDKDGFDNADEIDNNTNPCSAGSIPSDFDGDFVSDLNDSDDDNDALHDRVDTYALDPRNGKTTNLPVTLSWDNGAPNPGGILGLGFTGLMNNGSNYASLYVPGDIVPGGAAGIVTVVKVPKGTAAKAKNKQRYGFQFGINVNRKSDPFTIETRIPVPFRGVSPKGAMAMGIFFGTGDQDNYVKLVLHANKGKGGAQLLLERNGTYKRKVTHGPRKGANILGADYVDLRLYIDPSAATAQASIAVDGGSNRVLGTPVAIPKRWFNRVTKPAVGLIATSAGGRRFPASWEYLNVSPLLSVDEHRWATLTATDSSSADARHENGYVEVNGRFYLLGGRGKRLVNIYDPDSNTWSNAPAPPIELHHFQAVAYKGLIYVVGAMTGGYPNEKPVPNIYIFDPFKKQWSVGPPIPSHRLRGSAGAVVYNDRIYLVGGIRNGHRSGHVAWFDEFNLATGKWRALPDAPRARDHFQAAVIDQELYLAGGRTTTQPNPFDHTVRQVDVYDFTERSWKTLKRGLPTLRAGAAVVAAGKDLLVIGGESTSSPIAHDETEALDTSKGRWRMLSPLVEGRHGTQAILYQGKVYIVAGSNRAGGSEIDSQEVFSAGGD